MKELIFVTGNKDKLSDALQAGSEHGVTIIQANPSIDEIQAEDDTERIARRKAQDAFDIIGKPLVVSDDSWAINGLKGFPGPYMKSMNHWLEVDDFLRLTSHLDDRSCQLNQLVVYQDETRQVVFRNQTSATILREARGTSTIPWVKLVTLDGDDGQTIAEVHHGGTANSNRGASKIWHELFNWYVEPVS